MLLGAIADDFTGASDLANTLAKGGMATTQFVGLGPDLAPAQCEAGVVALKTRSLPVEDAVRQSLAAARWLLAQGCEQLVFKYCSTFDSTPKGNIGPVAEALLDLIQADMTVVCPAFPAAGRRVFMGHLFVGDRLLNESGMENHPLTPMTDANIRRWLQLQTATEVGLVSLDRVRGRLGFEQALIEQRAQGRRLIVVDAVADDDLMRLGEALAGHRLITGGSGIALGLPENFRKAGRLSGGAPATMGARGPAVVLCGSCSKNSQVQVESYLAANHPGLALDPAALMDGTVTVGSAADWFWRQEQVPIIYSTADHGSVADSQARHGRAEVAQAIELFFATLARRLVDGGVRRVVVGGGETSGAIVEALGVSSLEIGGEIDPGVPALLAQRDGPLGLALKSGNFGTNDFFEKAVHRVGTT